MPRAVPAKPIDALGRALKLLSGRDKSRAQLEAALVARGYTVAEVSHALQRCTELGYLDDRRVATDLARKLFAEGRSVVDVERRLQAKGLEPGVARQLGHDDLAAAKALLKSKGVSGVRAARLLLSRGFEEELVATLVDVPDGGE